MRPKRAYVGSEMVYFLPGTVNFRPEQANLRPEKAGGGPSWAAAQKATDFNLGSFKRSAATF